jgi:hypothetical protein
MNTNIMLLRRLVETLVEEWGTEDVRKAVDHVSLEFRARYPSDVYERARSKPKHRPSAVSQIERNNFTDEQMSHLTAIAARFDAKTFLPSTADIREFVISLGGRPRGFRDRSDGFKVVLETISRLPPDRLGQIANTSMFSGPAKLGPLSDAISEAASSRRVLQTSE